MSSMIITTARMTRAAPAQDMGFVNGNARTSRTACASLRITRTPTASMSHGRQPPMPHECRLTQPAASRWLNALVRGHFCFCQPLSRARRESSSYRSLAL
jgi:hypothetical protein